MEAIVVVFVRTRDAEPSVKQTSAKPIIEEMSKAASFSIRKTIGALKLSKRDEVLPPFWTWFIENPRRHGIA